MHNNIEANIIATFNGQKISYDAIVKGSELKLYRAEQTLYELRMKKLRDLLVSEFIKLDPKNSHLKLTDYISKVIATDVSVKEPLVDAFIKKRGIKQSSINAKLKGQRRKHIKGLQVKDKVELWYQQQL